MENASKALIIAGEILLGVLLLTLLVFAFRAMGSFSDAVDKNIETKNLNEFNTQFEIYRGRTDLTPQDVITIVNLARKYNKQANENVVIVNINVSSKYNQLYDYRRTDDAKTYEFIKEYNNSYFSCMTNGMEYNEKTGKIQKITIKKLQ